VDIVRWLRSNLRRQLYEIIIVLSPYSDAESKATCERIAKQKYVRMVLQEINPGIGWAYRQGFSEAAGSHLLMLDSDGEMDITSITQMMRLFEEKNCDVVVASRWLTGGGVEGYARIKYLYNRMFQYVFRLLFRTHIHDLSLGYKMLKSSVVKNIQWEGRFHEIATETTLKPIRYGYTVLEVPTKWTKRGAGKSKNKFRYNFRYVFMALKVLLFSGSCDLRRGQ